MQPDDGRRFQRRARHGGVRFALRYDNQPPITGKLDVSFFPPTLHSVDDFCHALSIWSTPFATQQPSIDLVTQLGAACPLINSFALRCPGLQCRLSFAELPRSLVKATLLCELYCDGQVLDFADMPATLEKLIIEGSNLDADINGQAPASLKHLDITRCWINVVEEQRRSLTISR